MVSEKHLVFLGRRWFDKVNGNTYHSFRVFVNGVVVAEQDFDYGYGEFWFHSAVNALRNACPGLYGDGYPHTWHNKPASMVRDVVDVTRKRDLKF